MYQANPNQLNHVQAPVIENNNQQHDQAIQVNNADLNDQNDHQSTEEELNGEVAQEPSVHQYLRE